MDDKILLAELQILLDNVPDFKIFNSQSTAEHQWLAKAHALVPKYDILAVPEFKTSTYNLGSPLEWMRKKSLTRIINILYRAVADLELRIPQGESQVYGPGAVYDFYKDLKDLLGTAQRSAFMIDPYFDENVLDTYLPGVPKSVEIKILLQKYAAGVKVAALKYVSQYSIQLEVRSSRELHDRIIFIDNDSCWVVGQSFNEAAKKKMTYLAPMPEDIAKIKKDHYDGIWKRATIVLQ